MPTPIGFLLDEDDALKQKLKGFQVINYADGQPIDIEVYFRFPDTEIRDRTFPHIAIDLVDVRFDPSRAHRANGFVVPIEYNQATPPADFNFITNDMPLPWMLIYQLACFSREPRHDRQLTQLMYLAFPEEYGFLDMSTFDGTVRRADFISATRRDRIDSTNKRLYCNVVEIGVSSELYLYQVQAIQKVSTIDVTYVFPKSSLP